MATKISIKELKNMPIEDLLREIKEQSAVVAKLRLGVKMNKEKDSAKYKKEKKQMARMKTIINEKNQKNQKKQKNQRKKPSDSLEDTSPKQS